MRSTYAMGVWFGLGAWLLVQPAYAGGIEPRVGFVDPDGTDGTLMLAVTGELMEFSQDLGLEGTLDFWHLSYDHPFLGYAADWSLTQVGFIGAVRYDFSTQGSVRPFVDGGLGLHLFRSSWEWASDSDSDTDLELGLRIEAGLDFPTGASNAFVLRGGFDGNGGPDYLYITAGYRFGN